MVFSGVEIGLDRVQQMIEKSGLVDHLFMGPPSCIMVCACACACACAVYLVCRYGAGRADTMAGQPPRKLNGAPQASFPVQGSGSGSPSPQC